MFILKYDILYIVDFNIDKALPMTDSKSDTLIIKKESNIGHITFNNPQSLNALTSDMVIKLTNTLQTWSTDNALQFIIIDSVITNAFSSGGDLKALYKSWETTSSNIDHINSVSPFFKNQYQLNYLIATYKKPIICLVSGICMGAAMGIAQHSKYQVVTDGSIMAMPETAIGFFPDVGAAYFLQNCTENMGFFLGLSGWRITATQSISLNLATHYVDSSKWKDFKNALEKTDSLEQVLADYTTSPSQDTELIPYIPQIQKCFMGKNISISLELLKLSNIPICQELHNNLISCSPTSLRVWEYHYQQSYGMSLKEILKRDYRISQNFLQTHDLYEGIRAILIDKDKSPRWKPPVLEDISQESIVSFYSLPCDQDLNL